MTASADVSVLSVPTALTVGVPFSAMFRVLNTGTIPLDPALKFRLGSQGQQDTMRWGRGRVELPGIIAPGQSVDFNASGFVPHEAGTFQFAWQMLQEGVSWYPRIAQSIQVMVSVDPNVPQPPPPPPPGLIVAPFPVSKWPTYPAGGLSSVLILNTGPFNSDGTEKVAVLQNDTQRTIWICKVDDWLGVDFAGRMDTQLYAARNSDGSYLFLSPRDHYGDGPQGNWRFHLLPNDGFAISPGDGLTFKWFARGFTPAGLPSPGTHAHYQTTIFYSE